MKFPVCVHDTHVVVKSDICRKPPIPGKCKAQFMRWYFNVHMGTCSWFTYSGCGGNQNKFRTAEDCERRCMGTKKDLLEERKHRRHNNDTAETIEHVPEAENFIDVHDHDLEESREPKLIRAPARAAEMIDLTSHITSSLQLGNSPSNATLTRKEEKKKRRREREKRKRQNKRNKNKINSRRLKKVEYSTTTESSQKISFLELGSNTNEKLLTSINETVTPKLAEFKGTQTAFSLFGLTNQDDKSVWMMDKQFRRRGKKYRNKSKEPTATKSRSDTLDVYSGAKQDTYYDKVKLFDILTHEAKEETKNLSP
ncbi:unnamed protein product [Candidula unifasciata]|uniref:BPTI/Kunitz inhibitor domain-containing protein n=1 Tax=Candidula unifasciata TaxID=100452 RepID=A0A8S3ZZ78_9EUPU|nr:unnamed protein product [Candidula unifasciata]